MTEPILPAEAIEDEIDPIVDHSLNDVPRGTTQPKHDQGCVHDECVGECKDPSDGQTISLPLGQVPHPNGTSHPDCIAPPRDNWNVTELSFAMDACQCPDHKDFHRDGIPKLILVDPEFKEAAIELATSGLFCGKCKREKVDGKCTRCGRPTEYTTDEEMIAKVNEYLESCKDEDYQLVKSEGDKSTAWDNRVNVNLPTLDGFSLMLGINDDTLVEWRKIHKKFSAACRKIELEQKKRLFNGGLSGKYNPVIAKLILSSNHGMSERVDSDITTNGKEVTGLSVTYVKPKE